MVIEHRPADIAANAIAGSAVDLDRMTGDDLPCGWELVQCDWSVRQGDAGGAARRWWGRLEAAAATMRRLLCLVLRCGAVSTG